MNVTLTPRAKDFVRINRTASIVEGQWLDKDRRQPTGPPKTWTKLRYRFDNGQQLTLNEDDLDSLNAAKIERVWWGDRHGDSA